MSPASFEHKASSNPYYEFLYDYPVSEWIVRHNLGRTPIGLTVLDSAGTSMQAAIEHTSPNETRVRFSVPISGKVVLV